MKASINKIIAIVFLCIASNANAQIPSYVPSNGLLSWYPFNNNGNDASSNLNNLGNYGATFLTDRFGNPSACANFNGATWMQNNMPSFTFSQTGAFTYSIWLNKGAQTSDGVAMMIGNITSGNFISLIQGHPMLRFGVNKQQSAWIWLTAPDTLNSWVNLVATYTNGIMRFYENGVFKTNTNFTYTATNAVNMPLYVGRGVSGNYYTGMIDDLGIWNRVLTQTEITALYNSSTTGIAENNKPKAGVIYPNPAKNEVVVELAAGLIGSNYSIVDMDGNTVINGVVANQNQKLDISKIASGMYCFEVSDKSVQGIKFVKE